MKRSGQKQKESNRGITLVALVVTIVVLLILAGITITYVLGDNSVFKQAESTRKKYNEAKAREMLETVLLVDAQLEKKLNPAYTQYEFLDNLITSEIDGANIKGDVVIIDGWAFELDRTVPKIGRSLDKSDKLIFPTVEATVKLANDKKSATITINASEDNKGINRIEIWLLGKKIEEFTYDNEKTVTEKYTTTQNGEYTIKVYGDLSINTIATVEGIVASVKFEPNGNETWKKSHSTIVTIQETTEKIVKAKYLWINSITTPDDKQFTEEQTFKSGYTITENSNNLTGTYYLWTMLETPSGEKIKWRSEGFNFDNEGPTITEFTATKSTATAITLSATAQDTKSGITKFEFYVDDVLKATETCTATTLSVTKSKTITGLTTGNHTCKVVVYDEQNGSNAKTISGTTKLYSWKKYSTVKTRVCYEVNLGTKTITRGEQSCLLCSGSLNWKVYNDSVAVYSPGTYTRYGFESSFAACVAKGLKDWGNYYIAVNPGTSANLNLWIKLANYNYVNSKFEITGTEFEGRVKTTYTKGDTQYAGVTSTNQLAYPNGGEQLTGSTYYWYVYDGEI